LDRGCSVDFAGYHAAGVITDREWDALVLVAAGFSQRDAALVLRVSRRSFRGRVQSGFAKIAAVRAAA
jgi:predicted DNA-binding protein (UPF0251 family)